MIKKSHKYIPLRRSKGSHNLKIRGPKLNFWTKGVLIRVILLLAIIGVLVFAVYRIFFYKKWGDLNYQWGMKNLSEGKFDQAANNFEKASSGGNEADALYKLAVSKYNQKDFEGAISAYEKVLEKDPKNPDAYNGLGNVYRDQKSYSKAEDNYKKAVAFNSSYIAAYSNWAIMLMDEGKIQDAKKVVQDGLGKNPNRPELINLKNIIEEPGL